MSFKTDSVAFNQEVMETDGDHIITGVGVSAPHVLQQLNSLKASCREPTSAQPSISFSSALVERSDALVFHIQPTAYSERRRREAVAVMTSIINRCFHPAQARSRCVNELLELQAPCFALL